MASGGVGVCILRFSQRAQYSLIKDPFMISGIFLIKGYWALWVVACRLCAGKIRLFARIQ